MNLPNHDERVETIVQRVRELAVTGQTAHIDKGGVHHFVPRPCDARFRSRKLDTSALCHVLEIDPERRRCIAEPGVRFRDLVRATLPHGLVPTVVPELEGITLGGAVAGCSVESTSFRHGGFFDSVEEIELITGKGELLVLSPEHDPAAFHMIHGSYGTLGVITRLSFRLAPAMPFVRMRYIRHRSFPEFHAALRARCDAGDVDFIDGIIHAPDHLTLCLGEYVARAPYVSDYRREDIFYKSTRHRALDYLTTEDYLFRYDTECHWLTRTVPGLEHPLVRRLLGKYVLGSTNLIRWSQRLSPVIRQLQRRPDVVVDLFIPDRRFSDFYRWYAREPRFFPLWVIPYRLPVVYPWLATEHAQRLADSLLIDCAIYGMPNDEAERDWSAVFEAETFACDGVKTLISRNHYTRRRFFEIYNQDNYTAVKQRLDPHALFHRDVYEKLHPAE
ncbi:MAG: FAD-binding oxidoreductase [Nannocystis sp.]|nr:FAD-binding oxidoreductase [Nannocystis sp.]MBA3545584.1 FAD-binding oxidoreductase [Nannocystis sp.]